MVTFLTAFPTVPPRSHRSNSPACKHGTGISGPVLLAGFTNEGLWSKRFVLPSGYEYLAECHGYMKFCLGSGNTGFENDRRQFDLVAI